MQKNQLEVLGNLASDATVATVSATRDVLSMRVITSRSWTDENGQHDITVGHNVVKFGKTGQFANFLPHLKKGQGVAATGTYEKEMSKPNAEGKRFLNERINTSYGELEIISPTSSSINEHKVAGFLASDAVIRPTAKGDSLSFTIMNTESWGSADSQKKTYAHDVVQFAETGKFDKIAALLVKGTGVYTKGIIEKSTSEDQQGNKFLNINTNASFNNVLITKYKTEKAS